MVVNDLDVLGARGRPTKANAPLIVDANAVLPVPVAFESLQPIAGRDAQILEATGDFQLSQLAACDRGNAFESPDSISAGEGLRVGAPKRSNHDG
jgi:hypothetical protein